MYNEIFAKIDLETSRKIRMDEHKYDFLPIYNYPVLEIGKANEVGRIRNVRLIATSKVTNMKAFCSFLIDKLYHEIGNNVTAQITLNDLLEYLNSSLDSRSE